MRHGLAVVRRERDGNIALAADQFGTAPRANEALVGVAGPKRRDTRGLAGFPDLTAGIEVMFSVDDKPCRALYDMERIPAHAGAEHPGRRRKDQTLPSGAAKTAR